MSIHDETWDKCEFCGETLKTFNKSYHGYGKCGLVEKMPTLPQNSTHQEGLGIFSQKKKLKTLKEAKKESVKLLPENYKTSIQCPECSEELIFENPDCILLSNPLRREVLCPCCRYSDYIFA